MVPRVRISAMNAAPVRISGDYVLYWMVATRRATFNFGLQRAVEHASALRKPLFVFEALQVGHKWASARFHQFVIDGMRDNAATFQAAHVRYYPYLERSRGEANGLLAALAAQAAVVVTDDFPCFFLPRLVASAAAELDVAVEAVDSNGLLPLRAAPQVFPTAHAFRRVLQKELPELLQHRPLADPLALAPRLSLAPLPAEVPAAWAPALEWLDTGGHVQSLPIDRRVRAVALRGGPGAGRQRLAEFLAHDFPQLASGKNHPDQDISSRLSPYLHWGHLSAHEVFEAVMAHEGWLGDLPSKATGAKAGWWGVGAAAENFLDELITWRELGFNLTSKRDDYDTFESLPPWAVRSLDLHESDDREFVYDLDQFEHAQTHDRLWNAAQRQLVTEGRIHNYLRMLWGKKILEWSATPREALAAMIELNNKYALDGRDPNSYSGIFWVLGRYDRPWHPERPIFGVIRYMSSANTARKMRVKEYVRKYAGAA
jgi:deoxyribodipyrimidine photo-lyase